MKLTKAMFMVLRALLLVFVGLVLWTLVGVNWVIDQSEEKVLDIMKMLSGAFCKYFRNVKRHVVNFAINFEVFADSFYGVAVSRAEGMYKELLNGFKIRKEIVVEGRGAREEDEEVIYYPIA